MKYKGIICFVYQKEKEKISQNNNDKCSIVFSEDFDEIVKLMPENNYIIVSLKMADKNPGKFKDMLIKFPNNKYIVLHDNNGKFSNKVLDIFWEAEIAYHNFTLESIIENINGGLDK